MVFLTQIASTHLTSDFYWTYACLFDLNICTYEAYIKY